MAPKRTRASEVINEAGTSRDHERLSAGSERTEREEVGESLNCVNHFKLFIAYDPRLAFRTQKWKTDRKP